MESTTTRLPLWEDDCEKLRKLGTRFEVRDVNSSEHWRFLKTFADRHHLKLQRAGSGVWLERSL